MQMEVPGVQDVSGEPESIKTLYGLDQENTTSLLVNKDGSVTLYIGPKKPEGDKAKNWLPTVAGKAWFPYFRFYSPKQDFLDRSWILPDIEKTN